MAVGCGWSSVGVRPAFGSSMINSIRWAGCLWEAGNSRQFIQFAHYTFCRVVDSGQCSVITVISGMCVPVCGYSRV